MKFRAIRDNIGRFAVGLMCSALGVSTSGYYAWRNRGTSSRTRANEQLLRQIREHPETRLVPVVILTSSREEQDRLQGYLNGANSYIRKPIDFAHFVEAVRQVGLYWLVLNEPPPEQHS